jgi:hypothetical protein
MLFKQREIQRRRLATGGVLLFSLFLIAILTIGVNHYLGSNLRNSDFTLREFVHRASTAFPRHRHNRNQIKGLQKNVILALAENVQIEHITIFVKSLREFTKGDIILFSPYESERLKSLANITESTIVLFDPDILQPPDWRNEKPTAYRWILFNNFLQSHAEYALWLFQRLQALREQTIRLHRSTHLSSRPYVQAS